MSLVSDRILELGVARVRRNCRIARDTRGDISIADAMDLLHPVNTEALYVALSSAEMVLAAEPPHTRASGGRNLILSYRAFENPINGGVGGTGGIPPQRSES